MQSGLTNFENGKMNLTVTASGLRKGIYYLHLNQGAETKVVRLLKQ
jgi:hypothetical protein